MPLTNDNLHDVIFSVVRRQPNIEEQARLSMIAEAAEGLCASIMVNSKPSEDQIAALRHVREALMNAISAVILKGAV